MMQAQKYCQTHAELVMRSNDSNAYLKGPSTQEMGTLVLGHSSYITDFGKYV